VRDGALTGIDVRPIAFLAHETSLNVIAAGGVNSLYDLCALRAADTPIAGVVVGKALYTGGLRLEDVLRVAREGMDAR
jgi:phosphoribosylformimino-5-aminoimidazole carboxamide ribotide isomerase